MSVLTSFKEKAASRRDGNNIVVFISSRDRPLTSPLNNFTPDRITSSISNLTQCNAYMVRQVVWDSIIPFNVVPGKSDTLTVTDGGVNTSLITLQPALYTSDVTYATDLQTALNAQAVWAAWTVTQASVPISVFGVCQTRFTITANVPFRISATSFAFPRTTGLGVTTALALSVTGNSATLQTSEYINICSQQLYRDQTGAVTSSRYSGDILARVYVYPLMLPSVDVVRCINVENSISCQRIARLDRNESFTGIDLQLRDQDGDLLYIPPQYENLTYQITLLFQQI